MNKLNWRNAKKRIWTNKDIWENRRKINFYLAFFILMCAQNTIPLGFYFQDKSILNPFNPKLKFIEAL